jgi:hypothetical protein
MLTVAAAKASVNVEIRDDTYELLLRLEAEGVIQSALLTTRPISRGEAARLILEAERNAEGKSPLVRNTVRLLKERFRGEFDARSYIKPADRVYFRYVHSDDGDELVYNNDGVVYEDGSNFSLGFASRAVLGPVSAYINPEFRYSEDDEDYVMRRAYGAIDLWRLSLQAGTDSQWWGPGRHGSILLSNNAQPFTMLKLSNPEPALLPWVFGYLGPFRFVFFVTALEEERTVPEPVLWGLRFNFKPTPYIEIGLQRTALFGGEGRPEDIETWWKSFTTRHENEGGVEAGDQRAGVDLKLTLPLRWQPFQLYAEVDGEDNEVGLPSKRAYLVGAYLPRILDLERLGLRAEYASTHLKKHPPVWYKHHIYRSGYTYKGRVIGHHMGTDSDDLFFELSYLMPELNGGVRVAYDRERHNLSGSVNPTEDEVSISVKLGMKRGLSVEGKCSAEKLKDFGVDDDYISLIMLNLEYAF